MGDQTEKPSATRTRTRRIWDVSACTPAGLSVHPYIANKVKDAERTRDNVSNTGPI